jgi:hypothetical protein
LLRRFEAPEQLLRAATSTRRSVSRCRGLGQATHSFCFVLHRAGFVVPPCLRLGRWALTPPFHPCSRPTERCRRHGAEKRFVFCDTFRRKELSFSAPLLSQGGLPCGVRTFLSGFLRSRSDRPPTRKAYLRGAMIQGVSFAGWQARSENALRCGRTGLTREASPLSVPIQISVGLESLGNSATAKS